MSHDFGWCYFMPDVLEDNDLFMRQVEYVIYRPLRDV